MTTDYTDKTILSKYYSQGLLLRRELERPATLGFIGNIKNKNVLDLGCGAGEFSRTMSNLGANVTGVDISPNCIDLAKKLVPDCSFFTLSGDNLTRFNDNQFDLVVMLMVFVNIKDAQTFKKIFSEASRVLKPSGQLIFNIIHPLSIKNHEDAVWKTLLPSKGNYLSSGFEYSLETPLIGNKSTIKFTNCHWSLEDISDELEKNNFVIEKIESPVPKNKPPKGLSGFYKALKTQPRFMFIKCKTSH